MGLKNPDAENLVPKTRLRSCFVNIKALFQLCKYCKAVYSMMIYPGRFLELKESRFRKFGSRNQAQELLSKSNSIF